MIKINMLTIPPHYRLDAQLCISFDTFVIISDKLPSAYKAEQFVTYFRKVAEELHLPINVDPVVEAIIEDERAGDENFTRSVSLITARWKKTPD